MNARPASRPLPRLVSWASLAVLAVLTALAAGCATSTSTPPTGTTSPPATGDTPARPPVSPLVSEQRWLDEWFRGTPVVIALADIHTLAVDVPLANSFDGGSSSVKPALAAVLDRIATSLRRQPAMRLSIATPADGAGTNPALASARADQVRAHLVSRGVPATRLSSVGTARPGAAVQLRLLAAPQAISRLDDAALPALPASGAKR